MADGLERAKRILVIVGIDNTVTIMKEVVAANRCQHEEGIPPPPSSAYNYRLHEEHDHDDNSAARHGRAALSDSSSFLVTRRVGGGCTELVFAEVPAGTAPEEDDDVLDPAYYLPLAVNLLSTLLYMMNYYIIQPSATQYINALGGHDALSATLIGAMPLSALMTSFPYSFWTNYSYKAPLLFTTVVLGVGNLLYASALSLDSLWAALLGRFIMGLGHQRTINKRFIADTAPAQFKTAVSAAFSLCQALGMSLGPGVAIGLGYLDREFDVPGFGRIILNGMTGPGYLMFAIWTVSFVFTVFMFQDPERIGLHELEAKEEREKQQDIARRAREGRETERNQRESESESDVFNGASAWVTSVLSNDEGDAQSFDAMSLDVLSFEDKDRSSPADDIEKTPRFLCRCRCVESMTPAIGLVTFLMFTNKFSIEMVISSASTLAKNRYGWELHDVGILGLVEGIMVIPLSFLVGWLSRRWEDRILLGGLLALSALGVALLVDPTDVLPRMRTGEHYNNGMWGAVGPTQYVVGSLLSFASLQACESLITSQLSKVVPHTLAKGTFNSGLISTLVGAVSNDECTNRARV